MHDSIVTALMNNRALQIEKLNPAVAQAWLSSSYGWYDPVFLGDVRKESDKDTGGFDPANFSADAVYEADSTIANGSVVGFLPSGMSYSLYGNYANAVGTRNSLDFDSYRMFGGVTVRQPLLRNLWIDQGRLTIKINKRNVRFSELGVQFVAMTVVDLVQQAYCELAYAYETQRIQQELVNTRDRMLSGVRRQFESGMVSEPDVQLAQSQVAAALADVNLALGSRALSENMLRNAMGDTFTNQVTTRLMPADYLFLIRADLDLQQSWTRGIERRPDLAQLRVNVDIAKTSLGYRRNQLFPGLDVIAGYGRRGASTAQDVPPFTPEASMGEAFDQISRGDAPRTMIGLALTIPLGKQTERGAYKATRHLKAQAELLVRQREELVLKEVSDAFHNALTSYDRGVAARDAVRYARAALEAEEKRLAGGTSSIFFVLQLQNDLVRSQLAEARARADYNKSISQLHLAEGTLLERQKIRVELE
ncbi:MAG TPA: TolC family protein [Methylomirabilota bacterium]|nr:TolC family protein [Methylomirabilota bacterium]